MLPTGSEVTDYATPLGSAHRLSPRESPRVGCGPHTVRGDYGSGRSLVDDGWAEPSPQTPRARLRKVSRAVLAARPKPKGLHTGVLVRSGAMAPLHPSPGPPRRESHPAGQRVKQPRRDPSLVPHVRCGCGCGWRQG